MRLASTSSSVTRAPFSANASANPKPIPLAPPVTMTPYPSTLNRSAIFISQSSRFFDSVTQDAIIGQIPFEWERPNAIVSALKSADPRTTGKPAACHPKRTASNIRRAQQETGMRKLRFGIFMPPFNAPATQNATSSLQRDVETVKLLDDLSYDEAWIGEHHSGGTEIIAEPIQFMC